MSVPTPGPHIWMRHEVRSTERRAPLVPADAARLVEAGFRLTVETSPQRAFGIEEYAAAGAEIAPAGSWVSDAPDDAFVLGLKELPDGPAQLRHRHIYFAHAYKGQDGAAELLGRFAEGGGTLLDIEYLVDDTGRRVVAFGYWAGYVGAALAALHSRGRLGLPLTPYERPQLDAALAADAAPDTALVIGAAGRSGRGALDALAVAGITGTAWDKDETLSLDREALLAHRILVNCVLATSPIPPFVRAEDLEAPHELAVIGDVTCDVTSALNVIPVNTRVTSWDEPVAQVSGGAAGGGVDVIAIDNLPSLLPAEASITFSADLLPQLLQLDAGLTAPVWSRAAALFSEKAE